MHPEVVSGSHEHGKASAKTSNPWQMMVGGSRSDFSGLEELSSAGQILQERDETYKQHVRWPSKKVDLPTSLVIEHK